MWPFKKRKKAPESKAVLGLNDALGDLLKYGTSDSAETPASALSLYKKSSAVSIPINKIAGPFASIEPVLEHDGDIATEHPVLELLNRPSPYFDKVLFFETLAKNYLVTNEAGIIALGGVTRPPLEIQPISPRNVNVIEGPGGYVGEFNVTGESLTGSYVPAKRWKSVRYYQGNLRELKQIRGFSTDNNSLLRGQSLLVPAAAEARQHILGGEHNVSLLEKGGRVSLVFHFEDNLTVDEYNETKGRIFEQYGGSQNAGQIGVTAGPKMTISEFGKTNKDMDFAMLQSMAKQAVALQYNVPLPLITVDATTLNNYEVAILALFDDAVLPLADKIFNGLSMFLLPRYGLDPAKYKITYSILQITALRKRVLEELKLRKEINIETDNELRPLIDREPYQGGDAILKPANLIPVGEDLELDEPGIARDVQTDEF